MKHLKKIIVALYAGALGLIISPVQAESTGRILIVASNLEDMGDPEKHDARNNLWEYAPPYHVFVSHGFEVDFVSPAGGPVPFMMDPMGISSYTIKYERFMDEAHDSLSPEQVVPKNYSAVFIGGGYGTLFDVASDPKLLSLIAEIYERGGLIGSCGHGAGAFANVKLRNGEYLVKGKRVAGYPNETEREKEWAKQGSLLPFLVEDKLRQNGAIAINKRTIADKNDVVVDERIVSTMFLPSAALVAKEMVMLLQSGRASTSTRSMKIGIIGAGKMGGTLAAHWARAGHEVFLSSRDPDDLTPLALALGPKARKGTAREAAAFGEVVLIATPYGALPSIGRDFRSELTDKVVIDLSNPYPERDGAMAEEARRKGTGIASAGYLPGVRLVRAFNSIAYEDLAHHAHRDGELAGVPYAADDAEAVSVAAQLIVDAGFDPVYVGKLPRAKDFDFGSEVYARLLSAEQLQSALKVGSSLKPGS